MMISKMWYICAMEYYLPVKKNRIASFAGKWRELEIIMFKWDKSNSERQTSHFHLCVESRSKSNNNMTLLQKRNYLDWGSSKPEEG
jgi:hypothetical protein